MYEDTDSSQPQLCRGPDRVDTVMDLMEPGMELECSVCLGVRCWEDAGE